MNWDDLKVFLDVSRRSRLEDAATHAQMDATTISRRLKRLEKMLGQTLFERTRRGHTLTLAGERLVAVVEKMESLSFDVLADTAGEQIMAGRVRVGAPEGLGSYVIAPALAAFKVNHPLIDIDLIALSGFVSVPKRQADMSILLTRPTAGRLKVRKLTDYSLHLYGTPSYLNAHAPVTMRDDLQDHVLIGYTEDLIYSSQLRYLDDVLPGLTPQLCSPSIVAQMEMVAAGAGIAILPDFMARRHHGLQKLLPDEVHVERAFWLAVHEDVAGLARNRAVVDFLADSVV